MFHNLIYLQAEKLVILNAARTIFKPSDCLKTANISTRGC